MTLPPPPIQYRCLNCPQKPEFLSKEQLVAHWNATHTVAMIERVDTVLVLGQSMALPTPFVAKHVEGPDV